MVDELTRGCLATRMARKLGSADVIDVLTNLFITHGILGCARLDNGPKFEAVVVKSRITASGHGRHSLSPAVLREQLHEKPHWLRCRW